MVGFRVGVRRKQIVKEIEQEIDWDSPKSRNPLEETQGDLPGPTSVNREPPERRHGIKVEKSYYQVWSPSSRRRSCFSLTDVCSNRFWRWSSETAFYHLVVD